MAARKVFKRSDLELLWRYRWAARTDILWLANNVLGFSLVNEKVHGPMVRSLQQFPMPGLDKARALDKILDNGTFLYTPEDPYVALEGARRRMLLFSRGFYKTTCNTITHSIQWLLNYPQIAVCDLFSVDQKSQDVLKNGILQHFRYNQKLRELFPEYCPQTRIGDFGSSQSFTLPNRESILQRLNLPMRVEPSLMAQSLDKGQAGYHFDIIKCSDIVEENNVQTPQQRQQVCTRFGLLSKMLVKRPDGRDGWIDLEGTFYHPDDLHSQMINHWLDEESKSQVHGVQIFVDGCFQRDTGDKPRKYDPSELNLPFKLDANGKRVPTWPEADPLDKLELEEVHPLEGGAIFAYQRVLDIKADKSQDRPFKRGVTWVEKKDFESVPIAYRLCTVDLADTTGPKSNNSVITVCAYDRMNRCYVESIQRGKWGPDDTLRRLFETWVKYSNKGLNRMCVEEYGYVRGLQPSIERKSFVEKIYPNWHFYQADRAAGSKLKNIITTLQTPFNTGIDKRPDLRFVEGLGHTVDSADAKAVEKAVEKEFFECTVFSTGSSDDILDTLAAQYKARSWFGEELAGHTQNLEAQTRMLTEQFRYLSPEQHKKEFHKLAFPDHRVVGELDHTNLAGW